MELLDPEVTADLAGIYSGWPPRPAAAYEVAERFYEIGSPEGLAELDRKRAAAAGDGRESTATRPRP